MKNYKIKYLCKECNKSIVLKKDNKRPVHCGRVMKIELPQCRSIHPEMIGNNKKDKTCDDGRGGSL